MIFKINTIWSFIPSLVLLLIGCLTLLFSILIVFGHWNFFSHINELNESTSSSAIFGFNYIPLIMGIILLISSIVYTTKVVSFSAHTIPQYMRHQQTYAEEHYRQYQINIQEEKVNQNRKSPPVTTTTGTGSSPKFCPDCGTKLDKSAKFCQSCGHKLKN